MNKKNISSNIGETGVIQTDYLYKEYISEKNKVVKYCLNLAILLGALGFLDVGISSYVNYNIVPFLNADKILFFPQGLTMCFYGICGLVAGINQMRILILSIGEGYNEFDKKEGVVKIYRKGQQSDVEISYPLKDILRTKILEP